LKVLVTGAAGFVGSHLVDHLLAVGHNVVGLDAFIPYYPRAAKERNLAVARTHPRFEFIESDLRIDALESAVAGVEVIVHEAAMAGLMLSWHELGLYAGCNLVGTQRLLDAAVAAEVPRFIHISTSSVYGANAVGDESQPTVPTSPYGITKLAAEHLVSAAEARHGLDATILRYFSIYGPRQRPDMAFHIFARAMMDGRPITVYGDGLQSRSNTFVDDCVSGTVAAIGADASGGAFNIGGGKELTLMDAIAIIADELGVRPTIRREAARPGDQRRTVADTRRAAEAFGYAPSVSPADGLRRQVAWHLEESRREALGES